MDIDLDAKCYDAVTKLMEGESYYNQPDHDFTPYISIPIALDLIICAFDLQDEPVFFATLAFPDETHIQKYIIDRKFPLEGFYGDGNTPWVIDFCCSNPKRNLRYAFITIKNLLSSSGFNNCYWIRSHGKFGWHSW
jgi:hemolysin-activating ACP:hemolysin acyltransferase